MRTIIAALALSLDVAPTFACPPSRDIASIGEAMKNAQLSPAGKIKITEYRLYG